MRDSSTLPMKNLDLSLIVAKNSLFDFLEIKTELKQETPNNEETFQSPLKKPNLQRVVSYFIY